METEEKFTVTFVTACCGAPMGDGRITHRSDSLCYAVDANGNPL